jgi:hypothetical protein
MKISIIEQRGHAALVEWRDGAGLHRATLPARVIGATEGEHHATWAELQQGIPFGMDFMDLEIGNVGAASIARELHERGIWTADDVKKNVAGVRAALLAAYGKDLETLLNAARAAQRHE